MSTTPFIFRFFGCLLLPAIVLTACRNAPQLPAECVGHQAQQNVALPAGLPSTPPRLADGDLVLRTGNDVISELFAQLNQHNKTFSHCGILMKEDGHWMVYHAIGGEENPDEHMRRDPLEKFISRNHNLGYAVCRYPFNDEQVSSLHQIVDSMYTAGTRFDMQFNLGSDDRLYCAEMVYKAFNKTLHTPSFCQTSIHRGFQYISTDNLFLQAKMKMLCHVVY